MYSVDPLSLFICHRRGTPRIRFVVVMVAARRDAADPFPRVNLITDVSTCQRPSPHPPRHPAPFLGIRETPRDGSLVARVQAGAAFDAILELEMDVVVFVDGVAAGGAHEMRRSVRTARVADLGIDQDVRFRIWAALVTVTDEAEAVLNGAGIVHSMKVGIE
jgi:hypothetical protein